jgi:hypothetical protein
LGRCHCHLPKDVADQVDLSRGLRANGLNHRGESVVARHELVSGPPEKRAVDL